MATALKTARVVELAVPQFDELNMLYPQPQDFYLLHRLPGTDVLKSQGNTLTDPLADVLART
ncbi:hypothetical protein [Rheinheimera riviphila]|uniref:hypothetical protein n=1 Tax=Rheinheimera riviphila TaxID=1834037 RepID=UPI000FD988D9|nr:hypothetical protein [Rheinheimera riviphila]